MEMTKICASCGRVITWRKKWEKVWADVKYCGERCRRQPKDQFEKDLLALLHARSREATICPSEILPPAKKSDRLEMEKVRQAARRLVDKGQIEILQKGRVVDPSTFRGPIRLRLKK